MLCSDCTEQESDQTLLIYCVHQAQGYEYLMHVPIVTVQHNLYIQTRNITAAAPNRNPPPYLPFCSDSVGKYFSTVSPVNDCHMQ